MSVAEINSSDVAGPLWPPLLAVSHRAQWRLIMTPAAVSQGLLFPVGT